MVQGSDRTIPPGAGARVPRQGALLEVLTEARARGFLGPGPVERHVEHALALRTACPERSERALDLGSGGGVPGLVLALAGVGREWVLVDASGRRARFLTDAAARLGLSDRVIVAAGRAEELGRGPLRGTADLVVARGFGPPAVTAECASPFLAVQGVLVVAEPPLAEASLAEPPVAEPPVAEPPLAEASLAEPELAEPPASVPPEGGGRSSGVHDADRSSAGPADRWPVEGLAALGLVPDGGQAHPVAVRRFRQLRPCPARYPRRTGVPAKRPLFRAAADGPPEGA